MRGFKKISTILVGCMVVGGLTGCTDAQKNYWNESRQAALWEQTQVEQTMDADIVIPGIQMLLSMQSTAEVNQKTLDTVLEGNVSVKAALDDTLIKKEGVPSQDSIATQQATKEMVDVMAFNIGACIADHQMYFTKDYYKQMSEQMGITMLPAFELLEADYIGIEGMTDLQDIILGETMPIEGLEVSQMDMMSGLLQSYMDGEVGSAQWVELYESLAEVAGVNLPVVQEGNTYTINLDEVQVLQALLHTCDTSVANLEALNTLLELQLTEEEIKEIQQAYAVERENVEAMLPMVGMLVDGKLVVCTEKREDGALQTTMQLLVQPASEMAPFLEQEMGGKMYIDMKITQVQKQVPVRDITSEYSKTIMSSETFSDYFVAPVTEKNTLGTY